MSTNQQTPNTPTLPPLQYPKSIPLVALALAFAVFLGINIILMPLLGMEPIQNEDEEGAVAALAISLAVGLVGGILTGVIGFISMRKNARVKHGQRCAELRAAQERAEADRVRAEADRAQRAAEERARRAEEEAERRILEECEFCGGDLEFGAEKGQTHEQSYRDGYTLEVKTDTTGIIRENRKSYYLTTGTDTYRCPHCGYTVEVAHEEFNGLLRRDTAITAYTSDAAVTRERVEGGRLYNHFKILPSQIRFY